MSSFQQDGGPVDSNLAPKIKFNRYKTAIGLIFFKKEKCNKIQLICQK